LARWQHSAIRVFVDSINQLKHIYIAPCVASESEARMVGTRWSKQCQTG